MESASVYSNKLGKAQKAGSFHIFKTIILITCLTITMFSSVVYAELATYAETEQVCQNWLNYLTFHKVAWSDSPQAEIQTSEELIVNDTVLAHVYHINPKGYIVVPVLKELPPVKMYSETSDLDIYASDGTALLLREVLMDRFRTYVEVYGSLEYIQTDKSTPLFDNVNRQKWNKYTLSTIEFESSLYNKADDPTEGRGPLVTATWHQNYPYNNFCPEGDGGRTVVGCVATAAAQIMHYWKWPTQGNGSHTYQWYGDNSCGGSTPSQMLTAHLDDPYDWDNMPDDCHGGCTQEEQDALAEFNSEVGITYNMDYGACGSGTYTHYSLNVLPNYFYYDGSTIDRENRSSHSPTSWFNLVVDEIEGLRPIHYRIYSHSILCDGWQIVDDIKQYHFNYGWDDNHNMWYTLDNLHCPWSGCGLTDEYMIRGIRPDPDADKDGILNGDDNCMFADNPDQVDTDEDGVGDECDNCPQEYNPEQYNYDDDFWGDVCDTDDDNDGIPDTEDNCPEYASTNTTDTDDDGVGDVCDNCDFTQNPYQYDENDDGVGDACDGEMHMQCYEVPDGVVGEPYSYQFWAVGGTEPYTWNKLSGQYPYGLTFTGGEVGTLEGVPNWASTFTFRVEVIDSDSPANKDTMDIEIIIAEPPYICGDANSDRTLDISDAVYLINFIFVEGSASPDPMESGNVNCDALVDVSDAVYLINFVFTEGSPEPCEGCK